MNRTLVYASQGTREALRLSSRGISCWSCVSQNHVLPRQLGAVLPTSIRLFSTRQSKKPVVKPRTRTRFPLLTGESARTPRRPRDEIRNEIRDQKMKRRVGVEQQRLERVIDYKSNKTPSERPRKTEGSSKTRKLPSPDEAGVYSPASRRPVKKTKKEWEGRPTTQKKTKAVHISASSLLKNYTSDFSVELPNGIPFPPPMATDRTPVQYPYFIRRTKSDNLPVYNVSKHGGSLQITQIHHVEGDPRELLLEIESNLGIPLDRLSYNPLTKRVVVKMGKMRDQVCEVLTRLGF